MTHINVESAANDHTANGQAKEAFVGGDVAISPNAPEEVPALLSRLSVNGEAFAVGQDEKIRTELLDTARSLVYALETPREAMIRFCWSQVLSSVPPIYLGEKRLI